MHSNVDLPAPYRSLDRHISAPITRNVLFEPGDYFTADQLTAYGQACRDAALEEAAEKCDEVAYRAFTQLEDMGAQKCAAVIRDLKGTQP